jgi:hypothetical protein
LEMITEDKILVSAAYKGGKIAGLGAGNQI